MLVIRLSRMGKKKKPMYRLVISEKTKDPYGRALEILGSWNPFSKELVAKKERIEHWLSVGAQMSPTVNNLLIEKEIIKGEKVTASKPGKKKEEKEEAKPAEEKPADDAKTEDKPTEENKTEEKPAEDKKEEAPAEEAKKEEKPTEDK